MTALGWCDRIDLRRQLAAAERLWPAEPFRARTAILLSCGDPGVESQARRALRSDWGVDEVVGVVTPVRALAASDPQTSPWLRAWLAREIHDLSPALIAVAAHPACAHIHEPGGAGPIAPTPSDLEAAVAQLRDWGIRQRVEPLWLPR
jgi:hypothetical protein